MLGGDALDIGGAFDRMVKAVRNAGRPGAVGYAISAVDVALWDLKARLLGLPLHRLRVAAVAASYHLEISGHCARHLHAHVAMARPNLRHLEWFHDHVRIELMFFNSALDPKGGVLCRHPTAPGHGLHLRREVASRYQVGSTMCRERNLS